MNNEQLQDWLSELHDCFSMQKMRPSPSLSQQQQDSHKVADHDAQNNNNHSNGSTSKNSSTVDEQQWRTLLQKLSPQTNMLLNYLICNFDDLRLSEPLITQLLSLYYRFGIARCFVMQLVPTFIYSYFKALTKRWIAASKMLEMFFLAIYNEEILAAGPGTPSMAKKADEIRLPLLRLSSHPSIAKMASAVADPLATPMVVETTAATTSNSTMHAPRNSSAVKIQITTQAENVSKGSQARLLSSYGTGTTTTTTAGTSTVSSGFGGHKASRSLLRIGPFPAIERMIAENRFIVLTRLMRTVNQLLHRMSPDVVCRAICISLLYICRSGFSFKESDFRQRVLGEATSNEIFAEFSKKQRIRGVPASFFTECMNGLTYALLNGYPDIALRALDALHQRAQYEMMADVLLETNALRYALTDPKTVKVILTGADTEPNELGTNGTATTNN